MGFRGFQSLSGCRKPTSFRVDSGAQKSLGGREELGSVEKGLAARCWHCAYVVCYEHAKSELGKSQDGLVFLNIEPTAWELSHALVACYSLFGWIGQLRKPVFMVQRGVEPE